MRRNIFISVVLMLLFLTSCGGPDALVINTVHEDGSVSRKIILTHSKDEFDLEKCQVPIDSSWTMEKELEVSEKGDSTWTLTAEKEFASVNEINESYNSYGGDNGNMTRWTEFTKKFRWFTTIYRYSENIEKAIDGYAPEEFFSEEELEYFYMPDKLIDEKLAGADSSYIKSNIIKPMEEKHDLWLGHSLAKACIKKLSLLLSAKPETGIDSAFLFSKEDTLVALLDMFEEVSVIDSVYGEGFYKKYQAEVDTTFSHIEVEFDVAMSADAYLIQTIMPGDLIATNGYNDQEGNVLWKVDGNCILSKDHIMWAESKISNTWAWIVTAVFLVFVISGIIVRSKKKGRKK